MATPMSLGGSFIGWHIPWTNCAGTGLPAECGYFDVDNDFVSKTLPTGWVPMANTSGGGGGGGSILEQFVLVLPSGMALNDTRYPDYAVPGAANNDRVVAADVPSPYTVASWRKISLAIYNVQANTSGAVTVILRNITAGTSVATLTIPTASAPDSHHRVRTSAAIASGTFGDGEDLQWHLSAAPANNAYGLVAIGTYELS